MADIRRDRQCIVDVFQHHTRRDFDVVSFIETMRRLGLINKRQYRNLHRTCEESGYKRIIELSLLLLSILNYEQICFIFEEEGYLDISSDLRLKRYTIRYNRLPQIEMLHSRRTQNYYQSIKSCIDDNAFIGDKRQVLRNYIHTWDERIMATTGLSQHTRQFAMEKKAAVIVLLLQQYKNTDERKTILHQLTATETNGLDNTSLEIVFHSKMAITEADAGNIEKANEHIVKTKEYCCMYKPCFAITNAFHDIEYAYKSMYFRNPSEDLLDKILTEGDIGVQSLNDESEDVQNLWKRIMLLFMVLSLLSITPDFVVGDTSKIKEINKKRAEAILKEIKRRSDDMQLRRQMILHLCMAVLNKERDIKAAEIYAKHAVIAAEKGGCFRDIEKQNVTAYLRKIQREIWVQKIFKWFINVKVLIIFIAIGLYVCFEMFE